MYRKPRGPGSRVGIHNSFASVCDTGYTAGKNYLYQHYHNTCRPLAPFQNKHGVLLHLSSPLIISHHLSSPLIISHHLSSPLIITSHLSSSLITSHHLSSPLITSLHLSSSFYLNDFSNVLFLQINHTRQDWQMVAAVDGEGFYGPPVIVAKACMTSYYPLMFRPSAEECTEVLHGPWGNSPRS